MFIYRLHTASIETGLYIYTRISYSLHTDGVVWCTEKQIMTKQGHVVCFSRGFCPTVAELVPLLMTFIQSILSLIKLTI
jgi:hypothetical protein